MTAGIPYIMTIKPFSVIHTLKVCTVTPLKGLQIHEQQSVFMGERAFISDVEFL